MNLTKPNVKVKDPVEFRTTDGLKGGFIASISGHKAHVVTANMDEYIVSLRALRRKRFVAPKRVFTKLQIARCSFSENDTVSFNDNRGNSITGSIVRLNKTRASVKTADCNWNVPYSMLYSEQAKDRESQNMAKLISIANQADKLLKKHKLSDWQFNFDNAKKRAGKCAYDEKTITMSEQFCLKANNEEVTDTVLHEIAHALVGAKHGHDAVWQAKAREIGCSAQRTHCLNFAAPKYIVSCKMCGIYGVREKRGTGRVCKQCKTPVTYELYSEDLWRSYQT